MDIQVKSTTTRVVTEINNDESLLKRFNPDLFRIYRAIMIILKWGGNGSIEAHFGQGKLKEKNGLYIRPSFDDSIT